MYPVYTTGRQRFTMYNDRQTILTYERSATTHTGSRDWVSYCWMRSDHGRSLFHAWNHPAESSPTRHAESYSHHAATSDFGRHLRATLQIQNTSQITAISKSTSDFGWHVYRSKVQARKLRYSFPKITLNKWVSEWVSEWAVFYVPSNTV